MRGNGLPRSDNQRRGAVADLAAVACRKHPVLPERRAQPSQFLHRRVRANTLVRIHHDGLPLDKALDGNDLLRKEPLLAGLGGVPVRKHGQFVQVAARNPMLRRKPFRLLAHRLPAYGVRQAVAKHHIDQRFAPARQQAVAPARAGRQEKTPPRTSTRRRRTTQSPPRPPG